MKQCKLKVGDRGHIKLGRHWLRATVIEDRRSIGVLGRQIVRICIEGEDFDADFEIAAVMFRRARIQKCHCAKWQKPDSRLMHNTKSTCALCTTGKKHKHAHFIYSVSDHELIR